MKYSFIVPTYNSKRWIDPCISSILAQTFPHFDIVVLDSGSTDDTVQWIRSLNDGRIRIYTTDSRLSIVENWQRMSGVPRYEFMTIMGHDDVLYPNYLATIDKLIESFPDAGLYQTHFNFIDASGEIIRPCLPMQTKISPESFLKAILNNSMDITATGFMMRSAVYDAIGGIPAYPNLLYADIELWLKLILHSYLSVSPEPCFEFRFHIDNTSKSAGRLRIVAFERMIDFLGDLKKSNETYKLIIESYGSGFLKRHVAGACHKLIYIPKAGRDGVTMDDIVDSAKRSAKKILPRLTFTPENFPAVLVAKLIDKNPLLRYLFLFYKSFKKRTF